MEFVQTVFFFLVTLGLLVTIHEFGHFVVARWSGVGVVRFAVGFGRPLLRFTDRRGTEFVVGCIPLGGYVRMLDDRDAPVPPTDSARAYGKLSPWWRIAIALGGPFANFALAIAAYWLIFVIGTTSLTPTIAAPPAGSIAARGGLTAGLELSAIDGRSVQSWEDVAMALAARLGETGTVDVQVRQHGSTRLVRLLIVDWQKGVAEPDPIGGLGLVPTALPVLGKVLSGSAADAAGLRSGDRIEQVNGAAVATWRDWERAIRAAPAMPLRLTVARDRDSVAMTLVPEAKTDGAGLRYGLAGVMPQLSSVRYGPVDALSRALRRTGQNVGMTVGFVKKIVTGLVSSKNISGPITSARIARASAQAGFEYFVDVLALLSISLGVLNLLPIPVLDGGHVLFCSLELVLGRPVPEAIQAFGLQLGLVFVAGLMMLAIYNDLARLF